MQDDGNGEVLFIAEMPIEQFFDLRSMAVERTCFVARGLLVELHELDDPVRLTGEVIKDAIKRLVVLFQDVEAGFEPRIGGSQFGEIFAIFPIMMAVQVGDEEVAEMAEAGGELLRIRRRVEIAFGVFAHEFAQAAEHLMRAEPILRGAFEVRVSVPIVAGVVGQKEAHLLGHGACANRRFGAHERPPL